MNGVTPNQNADERERTANAGRRVTRDHLAALQQIGKLPNFTPPSKHAAGRVGKKRPKRRNRRKP